MFSLPRFEGWVPCQGCSMFYVTPVDRGPRGEGGRRHQDLCQEEGDHLAGGLAPGQADSSHEGVQGAAVQPAKEHCDRHSQASQRRKLPQRLQCDLQREAGR